MGCTGLCMGPMKVKTGTRGMLTRWGGSPFQHNRIRTGRLPHICCPSTALRRRHRRAYQRVRAESDRQGNDWRQGLWTAVDLTATLGSIGGAVAFVLTQEAMLVGLPVVLPLLALYASRKREKAVLEAALMEVREAWQGTAQQLQQREATQVQQVGQAVQQLREDLQRQLPSGKLKAIESKLAALEGSVLSAGRSAQSAARTLDAAGAQLADASAAKMASIGQELLKDMQQGLQSSITAPLKQLTRLDSQMEGIQDNLDMLQQSQTDTVRQLAQDMVAALEDSESQLQRALQAEARRSEQNFQRLPALIAAALPVTDVTALQVLPEGGNALSRPRPAAQLAPADRTWLQTLLESAVQQAADKVSTAQDKREAQAIPAVLAEEQWEALGRRLRGIESSLQSMADTDAASTDSGKVDGQALAQLEGLQLDVRAALAAAQEAQSNGPVLQDSLAKVTTLLETMVSQKKEGPGLEELPSNGAVSSVLEQLQGASSELSRARAALEAALQERPAAAAAATPDNSMSTRSVQDAARIAALEVLREVQQQGNLGVVGSSPPVKKTPEQDAPSSVQSSSANGVPKGYKGDPSDTRADAFRKMQDLLKSQDRPSSSQAAQPGPGEAASSAQFSGAAQTSTEDLVPISAWLGQPSEPMDRRIAEEALLAGVDYNPDSLGTLDAGGALSASSGSVLAPGAAEGLASAPVQQQYSGSAEGVDSSQSRGTQSRSGSPGQGGDTPGMERAASPPESSSNQDSRPGRKESALPRAGEGENRQEAYQPSDARSTAEEDADVSTGDGLQGIQSTGLASGQEAYREGGPAENGAWEGSMPAEEQLAALLEEGKGLLRQGRELSRSGYEYGEADALLQDAMACFEEAAAIDPISTKVLGNWGNALMAYGTLKKRYLSALQEGPQPYSYEEQDAATLAEEQITAEAEAALVAAGQKFLAVVEQNPEDRRALGNWGNALCLRAELAQEPEVACALYEAAVAKYEAVLERDPRNRPILRNCAFAMYDLGRLQPDPASRAARQLLEDAARYFQDVLMLSGEDEDVAAALDTCMSDLEDFSSMS